MGDGYQPPAGDGRGRGLLVTNQDHREEDGEPESPGCLCRRPARSPAHQQTRSCGMRGPCSAVHKMLFRYYSSYLTLFFFSVHALDLLLVFAHLFPVSNISLVPVALVCGAYAQRKICTVKVWFASRASIQHLQDPLIGADRSPPLVVLVAILKAFQPRRSEALSYHLPC